MSVQGTRNCPQQNETKETRIKFMRRETSIEGILGENGSVRMLISARSRARTQIETTRIRAARLTCAWAPAIAKMHFHIAACREEAVWLTLLPLGASRITAPCSLRSASSSSSISCVAEKAFQKLFEKMFW